MLRLAEIARPPRSKTVRSRSPADVLAVMRQHRLLTTAQLAELTREFGGDREPSRLKEGTLGRGWLTEYQLDELLLGRGEALILGAYLLLDRLGEGGMGQVFLARHRELERRVALKIIRADLRAEPGVIERFRREARAAARLSSPHVVAIHDAGEAGGKHFLVMEYVVGTDLARLVRQAGPLSVALACELTRQAAMGLRHIHEHGLVHRDVKPSNLLLARAAGSPPGEVGTVKLLDLGLARHTAEEAGATALTVPQALMGTVNYLAPEQANDAHAADIRADLYSLGCTLYHLLTGRPPFPEGTTLEKLYKHQWEEAVPVEQLRPEVPVAVASVVRRLMAKQPAARYQTPAEVVAALEAAAPAGATAALTQSPAASPTGCAPTLALSPRPVAFGMRRARTVAFAAGTLLLVLAGIVAFRLVSGRFGNAAPSPDPPGPEADERPLEERFGWQIPVEERFPWQPQGLVSILGEQRGRHWGTVRCVVCSPDRQLIASGGDDGLVRVWDSVTLREHALLQGHGKAVDAVAFAPQGRLLAFGGRDRCVRLWDLTEEPRQVQQVSVPAEPSELAFSADGKSLAVGDTEGRVLVWRPAAPAGEQLREFAKLPQSLRAVALAPDGGTVLALGGDGTGRSWWVSNGLALRLDAQLQLTEKVYGAAFTPGGAQLAVGCENGVVIRRSTLGGHTWVSLPELRPSGVAALAFSPDGRALAAGDHTEGTIQLWDLAAATPQKRAEFTGSRRVQVRALAFAGDGGLVAGGDDGTVRMWDLGPTRPAARSALTGPTGPTAAVAWAPDAKRLITAGSDETVRLWDLAAPQPREIQNLPRGENGPDPGMALSPNGRWLAFSGNKGRVEVWDVSGSEPRKLALLEEHTGDVKALAFSPDGKTLATAGDDKAVRLWDWSAGPHPKSMATLPHAAAVVSVSFSADRSVLATVTSNRQGFLWRLEGGDAVPLTGREGRVLAAVFAPSDPVVLASSAEDGTVCLWDREAKPVRWLAAGDEPFGSLAFSPDGRTLALTGARTGRIVLWVPSTEERVELCRPPLPAPVKGVAFSPDGRYLATANANGTAYILSVGSPAP
jgi:serine/threonine-protein kinase